MIWELFLIGSKLAEEVIYWAIKFETINCQIIKPRPFCLCNLPWSHLSIHSCAPMAFLTLDCSEASSGHMATVFSSDWLLRNVVCSNVAWCHLDCGSIWRPSVTLWRELVEGAWRIIIFPKAVGFSVVFQSNAIGKEDLFVSESI